MAVASGFKRVGLALVIVVVAAVLLSVWALSKPEPGAGPLLPDAAPPSEASFPLDRETLSGASREVRRNPALPIQPPTELLDPRELVEGSEAWDQYMVWDADYYARADPSRIYVSAPRTTSEARPPLLPLSASTGFGQPNQPYPEPLRVRAAPGVPVTFYAPDWGTFPNGQKSITVKSDASGVATTKFTFWKSASYYRVVASSPLHEGWVIFELEALDEATWQRFQALLGNHQGAEG